MDSQPLGRKSLVGAVVQRIREIIVEGGLRAGDRLPSELELVKQLGVSRTVLREAVKRLEPVGLVSVERGKGTYVGDQNTLMNCVRLVHTAMAISTKELMQFLELRGAIEQYAVRRAAERAGPEDVAELAALCERMSEEMEREDQAPREAIRLDLQFHLRLVGLARIELLRDVMEVVQQFVMEGMLRTWPNPRQYELGRDVHVAIVNAIRAGDPDAAERALRAHMDVLFSRLQEGETPVANGRDHDGRKGCRPGACPGATRV